MLERDREALEAIRSRTDPYYCANCGHHAMVHVAGPEQVACTSCECKQFAFIPKITNNSKAGQ